MSTNTTNPSFDGFTRSNFEQAAIQCFLDKAKVQETMNKLVGSVIYIALTDKDERSLEANRLLAMLDRFREGEAAVLRRFLLEYGPFTKSDPRAVRIGEEVTMVKYAVKYSEQRHKEKFTRSPESYYDRAVVINYWLYSKREAKAANAKPEKTAAQKVVALQAAMTKILKQAQEDNVPLDIISPLLKQVPPAEKLASRPSPAQIIEQIKELLRADAGLVDEVTKTRLQMALGILCPEPVTAEKAA